MRQIVSGAGVRKFSGEEDQATRQGRLRCYPKGNGELQREFTH